MSWAATTLESKDFPGVKIVLTDAIKINYAVRKNGFCLSKSGKWEYEPSPSNRDDDFYSMCRFESFEEAMKELQEAWE